MKQVAMIKFEIWGGEAEMTMEMFTETMLNLHQAVERNGENWNEWLERAGFKQISVGFKEI